MQLIAVVCTKNVVTEKCAITKTEHTTTLLTDHHTCLRSRNAIELVELLRISKRLECRTELLSRNQAQILAVVGILSTRLSAGRRLGDTNETIPGNTIVVETRNSIRNIKNAAISTSLIELLTRLIPSKGCHCILLLEEKIVYVMIEFVGCIKSIK